MKNIFWVAILTFLSTFSQAQTTDYESKYKRYFFKLTDLFELCDAGSSEVKTICERKGYDDWAKTLGTKDKDFYMPPSYGYLLAPSITRNKINHRITYNFSIDAKRYFQSFQTDLINQGYKFIGNSEDGTANYASEKYHILLGKVMIKDHYEYQIDIMNNYLEKN